MRKQKTDTIKDMINTFFETTNIENPAEIKKEDIVGYDFFVRPKLKENILGIELAKEADMIEELEIEVKRKASFEETIKSMKSFLEALSVAFSITGACQRAKISYYTYNQWLEQYPEFDKLVRQFKEIGLQYLADLAEDNLKNLILGGSENITKYVLNAQAQKRGWKDKHEVAVHIETPFEDLTDEELDNKINAENEKLKDKRS